MTTLYDDIGGGYSTQRRPDPRVYQQIRQALSSAKSVLNVGAGTGSYEPSDVPTWAVEPSLRMIRQRPSRSNVVQGRAEALPFADDTFDATLAILTLHHWTDRRLGLAECVRTSRRQVTLLTWDPEGPELWLTRDYFPEIFEYDLDVFPTLDELAEILGPIEVQPVPIPADCVDGFLGAYWQRPEAYLHSRVRASMSSFARVSGLPEKLARLEADLESGRWHERQGELLSRDVTDLGYRLVTARVD